MGIVRQLLATRAAGHPSQHSLAAIFGMGPTSYTGVSVTEESAMTYSAVFAAIRLLAWSTAMLPLLTYRRQERGKVRAEDHPLYPLLKEEANPEMTAFDFRSTLMAHAVGRGNGYAEIEWSKAGQPLALWPLNPAKTKPERVNGELRYLVDLPDGTTANLPSWRVHHVRGLSGNGIVGYSPVRLAMQAIGLGLATEEFGSRFFGNGARPGLIVKHPGVLSDTAFDKLKKSWNADHEGLSNSHRVKILEEGMDIETVGVPPEEAQFLETRKFQVTEIARWFNVPPHMIADMSGATFSNIEEQGVEFVTYSLGPWLINVEQALTRDLLTAPEKKVLFVEHLVDGLLRGRTSERYAAYQAALQGGWMSPNEVRERENLNPYDGGDTYLLPMNMTPADGSTDSGGSGLRSTRHVDLPHCDCAACATSSRGDTRWSVSRETDRPPSSSPQGGGRARAGSERRSLAEDRRNLFEAYVPMMEDVAARMVRREVQDVERALGKHIRQRNAPSFIEWLETYYASYGDVVGEAFTPVIYSLGQLVAQLVGAELDEAPVTQEEISEFVEGYVRDLGEGAAASSRGQLVSIVQQAETEAEGGAIQDYIKDKISDRLQGWLETKARRMGRNQAFRAGNGLIIGNYTIKGVRSIEWLTNSGACAFCAKLDGKIVAIEEYFVQNGESLTGGADDAPMKMRSNKKHGPLHEGCSCTVRADERSSETTQAPTNNPYGPKPIKPVRGQTAGAKAARKLRKLDPSQARFDYLDALGDVDLRLFQADLIRKDLRNLDDGIYPDYIQGDAGSLAAYRQRLEEELDAAVAVHIAALDKRDALKIAQDKAYDRAEAETKKILGGGNYDMFPTIGKGITGDPDKRERLNEAMTWLDGFISSETVTGQLTNFKIDAGNTDRSYYQHIGYQIEMSASAPVATYIHEIGHALDQQNDEVKQKVLEFYNRRTAGLVEEQLSKYGAGYGPDELCKADEFLSPYCGKLPNSRGGTELVSMGLQYMYEEPFRFAFEDPEHFALIYDLFRGE